MLADKVEYYKKEKKMLRNTPARYKKEYPWLKEVEIKEVIEKILYDKCSKRKYLSGRKTFETA